MSASLQVGNSAPLGRADGGDPALVSVVIKTFNEEKKIARAIESALSASNEIAPLQLEVVVADSLSSDRTVEIACRYPIRVVQLADPRDRGCGTGVQLGYEWCRGAWIYLMDGDMQLSPGFLGDALKQLQADERLAGAAGAVVDQRVVNDIDRIRVNNKTAVSAGYRPWLDGGGLYRRAAIEAAGQYAADRNLLAYEEAELGLRLGHAGYQLLRLPRQAVSHEGHALTTWALMRRHWTTRRAMAGGVLLRLSSGKPWMGRALRLLVHPLATGLWWLLLLVGLWLLPSAVVWASLWFTLSLLAFVALAALKRDLSHALTSVLSWHYALAAAFLGVFTPLHAQRRGIPARLLRDLRAMTPESSPP